MGITEKLPKRSVVIMSNDKNLDIVVYIEKA